MENQFTPTTSRRVGYAFTILFMVVFLVFINNIFKWHLPFISQVLTSDFEKCLWALNLSLGASILGYFVFIFYDLKWFRHLMQAIFGGFSLVSTSVFLNIFPLDLPSSLIEQLVRWGLIFVLIATGISIIVELVKAVRVFSLVNTGK